LLAREGVPSNWLVALACRHEQQPAPRRVDLDHEVHAREVGIIRQRKVRFRRPADQEGVVLGKTVHGAAVRPLRDGQRDAEAVGRQPEQLLHQRADPLTEVSEAAAVLLRVGCFPDPSAAGELQIE
jgi:hypothetical protein